jgi:hypothetical protein
MHDDKQSWECAQTQEDETILSCRMIRVVEEEGVIIAENGGGLVERDTVFAKVCNRLLRIPVKLQVRHGRTYIRRTYLARGLALMRYGRSYNAGGVRRYKSEKTRN